MISASTKTPSDEGDREGRRRRLRVLWLRRGGKDSQAARQARTAERTRKREAKQAKHDLRDVKKAIMFVRKDSPRTGGGTLLTEPILVFTGRHNGDFKVFDEHANQLGLAQREETRVRPMPRRVEYRLYQAGESAPVAVVAWPLRRLGRGDPYTIFDSAGNEIAQISRRMGKRPIMVADAKLGVLVFPRLWSLRARLEDNDGHNFARITQVTGGTCYLCEIDQTVTGSLRTIALLASLLCQEEHIESGGGS